MSLPHVPAPPGPPSLARSAETDDDACQLLEELFLGEALYLQEQDEVQATLACAFERDGGSRRTRALALVEYGITDHLQIEASFPLERVEDSQGERDSGTGNFELGALYELTDEDSADTRWALGCDVGFPTATVGEDVWSLEPFALVRCPGVVEVHAGLGLEAEHDLDEHDESLGANAAFALVTDLGRATGTFEVFGALDDEERAWSAAPGAVWQIGKCEVGFAVAAGLTDDAPDVQFLLTFTGEWSAGAWRRR